MIFNNDTMHLVWSTEQEILDVIHTVCQKHNLKYSLFYGTLLGAVRHGGFIPWDDDIDIIMPREDYNKLIHIWKDEVSEEYLMQAPYEYPDLVNNFSKVRKNHTTYLQDEEEITREYHKGIFVDIFPVDRVAPGIWSKIQYAFCAVNLLYSRGYTSGSSGVMGIIENCLLHTKKKNYTKRRDIAERVMTRWNTHSESRFFCSCTIRDCRMYFPSDLFENMTEISFNGKMYKSVRETDIVLKVIYGDYMQLPPEEERVWKHHPLLIDFSRNFEEIPAREYGFDS